SALKFGPGTKVIVIPC
ncbi:rCG23377, partial [Rattus norvegicus]